MGSGLDSLRGRQLVVELVVLLGWFYETGSYCTALAGLELASIDQAGLQLTDICMPLPSEC